MKQIIIIVGTIVIIFIAAMTIVSVESKDLRTDELNRAVSASIKKTVSDSQIENQSIILSDKEMVAYFIQLLSVSMKGKEMLPLKYMMQTIKRTFVCCSN